MLMLRVTIHLIHIRRAMKISRDAANSATVMNAVVAAKAVTDAIKSVDAGAAVDVDLAVGRVSVRHHTVSSDRIADAITTEGYTVEKLAA